MRIKQGPVQNASNHNGPRIETAASESREENELAQFALFAGLDDREISADQTAFPLIKRTFEATLAFSSSA
jgi:hypothetical protein